MIMMAPAVMLLRQDLNANETVKCSGAGQKRHVDINSVPPSRSSMTRGGVVKIQKFEEM